MQYETDMIIIKIYAFKYGLSLDKAYFCILIQYLMLYKLDWHT